MSDTRSTPEDGYTKAQLARYFHCPESTIRYYCARFAPYLPARGDGRGRRYAPSCLEVLAFIRERLPEARTSRAVEGLLARRYPHCVPRRKTRPHPDRAPFPLASAGVNCRKICP